MDAISPRLGSEAALVGWGRSLAVVVVAFAAVDWVGWATGIQALTRVYPTWPPMTPWTALWLAALGAAIVVQSGSASPTWVRAGRWVAALVGGLTLVVLAQYATARSFGVDQVWFGEAVRRLQSTWPGRPSPQTAVAALFMSVAVGLIRVNRPWTRTVWVVGLAAAAAAPGVAVLAYLFDAVALVRVAKSTGMALSTALGLLLLGAATILVRPDQNLVAWWFSRTKRSSLLQTGLVVAGFPILLGLSWRLFIALRLGMDASLALSTGVGTTVVGAAMFYLSRREQKLRDAHELDRTLLRASSDGMLVPQVLLEAVRDPGGRVVDFRYLSVNRATCSYLGLDEHDLIGHRLNESSPNLEGSELHQRYARCLEDGEPVILDDYTFFNEILDDSRRYDIRATRAGADLLSLTWTDVTERFNATERIAASEQNYRLLVENTGDIVIHVRDDRLVWVSPSVEDALGAPPDYWLGRKVGEVIPSADAATLAARLGTLAGGGAVQQRARVTGADGVTHWVHLNAKPFRDADGRRDGFTAALRLIDDEVAAQQEAEQAREQQAKSDERYRRSMETAALGMGLLKPDGKFFEVNPALCQLLGYDADTLTQRTWQDLTPPEYLAVGQDERDALFGGRLDSYRVVKQYIHADGHRIWADVSVSSVRDENGQVETLAFQIADITAAVEANQRNEILAQSLEQKSQRLAAELASAANYMRSIMPQGLTGRVGVTSRYLPSRELGGDCFDYSWIDDDHLLVYLIDVSGHGLEPALLSVSVHNMVRSGSLGAQTLLAPAVLLTALNSLFQMEQQGEHYFTMWCGVYQASARTLRYANAGSPPPFAFSSADGSTVSVNELSAKSTPIGMFEDSEFTTHTYQVPPGCQILIYSDGASEITLADDHQLEPMDFKKLLRRVASAPGWSLDGLIDELHALSPSGAFEDDFSLIQLKFD